VATEPGLKPGAAALCPLVSRVSDLRKLSHVPPSVGFQVSPDGTVMWC
jgi:hypothetical protein